MSTASAWQSYGTFARTSDAFMLSVLCKQSYRWDARGKCTPLEEQPPLALDIEHTTREDRNGELLSQGRDVWPLKLGTDVIVTGHARVPGGGSARSLEVGVQIGDVQREIVALGPRYVEYRGPGSLAFSEPARFSEVDVSWWNAYGGMDPFVLPQGIEDTPAFLGKPVLELFPGTYPRNPCGLGYLIAETPELLDGLSLPLLEHPAERLTPETLLGRDARAGGRRPPPAAFGWCHALWFPRIVQGGGKPYHLPATEERDGAVLRELALGLLDTAQLEDPEQRFLRPRWTNEAAPELILPFLRGDENVRLRGFDVLGEQQFQLPRERPRVQVEVDDVPIVAAAALLHSLVINADRKQFYLLFSIRHTLPETFAIDMASGEPLDDLLGRCRVGIDGQPLEREQWPASPEAEE
jgi:hypothetical protein